MNEQEFLKVLDELGRIYLELFEGIQDKSATEALDEGKSDRLNQLVYEIMDFMIDNPGTLVYVEDKSKRKFYETVINFTWGIVDSGQIIDRLFSTQNKLDELIGDYSDRAQKIKPIIIHVNPDCTEYTVYLEEAMSAWMYGLNNAAIILCFSVLENILRDKLCKINIDYAIELSDELNPKGATPVSFGKIVKSAHKEKLITYNHKEALFNIKKKRNNSVHKLFSVKNDEAYDIIIKTKDIVEHLLRN